MFYYVRGTHTLKLNGFFVPYDHNASLPVTNTVCTVIPSSLSITQTASLLQWCIVVELNRRNTGSQWRMEQVHCSLTPLSAVSATYLIIVMALHVHSVFFFLRVRLSRLLCQEVRLQIMIRLRAIWHGDFGSGRVELLKLQSLSALSLFPFTLTNVCLTIGEIFTFKIHYLRIYVNNSRGNVAL